VCSQGPVEDGQGAGDLGIAVQLRKPRGWGGEWGGGDDGRPRCGHRLRLGLRGRARAASPQASPLGRTLRGQHQHRLDERVGGWADQVAPVGRTEQEAELELDEAERAVAVAG
jgi:hypothetical protein